MKTAHFFWLLPLALLACNDTTQTPAVTPTPQAEVVSEQAETVADIIASLEVSNPSRFDRPDTLIRFSLNELGVTSGPLQVWKGETAQPSQLLDEDGDGNADRLVFLTSLEAAAIQNFTIDRRKDAQIVTPRAHAEVSIKEGGEWQESKYVGGTFKNVQHVTNPPQYTDHSEYIRYEGPGIESDLVGYRVYLDWRNGFDIFGKKSPGLVLQGVGQDGYDSYHKMADWGADILKVGQSLGMGGYGFWDGSGTVLVSDVKERSASVRSDGPIHSSLDIDYKGWNTGKATVDMKATLSMQAGSPMVEVDLTTSAPLDNLAIGIVAHPDTELIMGDLDVTGEAWSYMASFGKQTLFDDHLGMVVLFRKKDLAEQTRDDNSYVLVMKPRGTELSYAFGALWAGQQGGVRSRDELIDYLAAEVERRTVPPRVRLKTKASQQVITMDPLEVATRLASSEINRRGESLSYGGWDSVRAAPSSWSYTTGLLMQAMDDVSEATGDPSFAEYGRRTMDSYLGDDGTIYSYAPEKFNIDHINSGKMLQRLYAKHGDEKYRLAVETLAAQLVDHPRTSEGAFWHKLRYPHQLWLDGVYMGMPFLAGVGVSEGDNHKIEEAAREFTIARAHLRDEETGLYYHAWDEAKEQDWADPDTGRSHYVWARGLGWYAMALVDILDVIPLELTELREPLLEIIPELADSLVNAQDVTGTWFQIMDMPDEPGNYREASSSAMFTYFLAKAINEGYLPASYTGAAKKAYNGMVSEFISVSADGATHLTSICEVGGLGFGRDGSYGYYMSEKVVTGDPKGLGPAIMAGVQAAELLSE